MIRRDLSQMVLAIVIVAGGAATALAQGFGGGGFGGGVPTTEESFRRMDRNGNDTIDPEEWEILPAPIRRAYEDLADLSRPMEYDDFAELSQRMREQMMSRFGGGRGMDFGRGEFGRGDRARGGGDDEGRRGGDRDGGPRRGRGGFGPGEFDDASPSSADSGVKKGGKSADKVTKPRTPINVKLPEQYRSLDKDRDGQIGLYEWSRTDYAGFRKLDWNGDGFLTPQELLRGPGTKADLGSVAASGTGATSGSNNSQTGSGSGAGSPSSTSTGGGSAGRAETAFKLLDKNENGTISEEEWKKSLSAGPTFEKAGIKVSFPMSRNEFLRLFPQAYPSAGK